MKERQTSQPRKWRETFRIDSYWVDARGRLFPHVILQWFQEAAWRHAEALGFGHSHLKAKAAYWVLARLSIQLGPLPSWGEEIVLETWPIEPGRLMALREFSLCDPNGVEWGRAVSGWLILDAASGRPRHAAKFLEDLNVPVSPAQFGEGPRKLSAACSGSGGMSRQAAYSDIDLQNHVNNARYAAWMFDESPADWLQEWRLQELHLNFLKETQLGETVRVRHERSWDEGLGQVSRHLVSDENDSPVCLMEARWSKATRAVPNVLPQKPT